MPPPHPPYHAPALGHSGPADSPTPGRPCLPYSARASANADGAALPADLSQDGPEAGRGVRMDHAHAGIEAPAAPVLDLTPRSESGGVGACAESGDTGDGLGSRLEAGQARASGPG